MANNNDNSLQIICLHSGELEGNSSLLLNSFPSCCITLLLVQVSAVLDTFKRNSNCLATKTCSLQNKEGACRLHKNINILSF